MVRSGQTIDFDSEGRLASETAWKEDVCGLRWAVTHQVRGGKASHELREYGQYYILVRVIEPGPPYARLPRSVTIHSTFIVIASGLKLCDTSR